MQDLAYKIIDQRDEPGYATMINEGAFKENWKGQHAMMPSLGGMVGKWFYSSLLGIAPEIANAGFAKIIIKPEVPKNLEWVKGGYNSPLGMIRSAWHQYSDRVEMSFEIPGNAEAELSLPCADIHNLSENGQLVMTQKKIGIVRINKDRVVLHVGSGKYSFKILK